LEVYFLNTLLKPTWQLPNRFVPSAQKQYLKSLESLSIYRITKYLKRRVIFDVALVFLGRGRLLNTIDTKHRRILWVNLAAPSLGDSLMDLAARTLLHDRNLILLTDPKNAQLYENDRFFSEVYTSARSIRESSKSKPFDLVICDAFAPRVLLKKIFAAPWIDFVGLYGFLNGFEVHRTYFAFARMRDLLAINERDSIANPQCPTISVPALSQDLPEVDVCVAVGGEWSFRTYDKWLTIVGWLISCGYSVSLVGSGNGVQEAKMIEEKFPLIRSSVGKLSLREVILEVSRSKFFIGADGGLWHIACAIPIPTVVLFADCKIFDEDGNRVTRETKDMLCETLYDDVAVSNIEAHQVIEAFERLRNQVDLAS
jgi:ADP-heptose:LPS heptosyltransferase